jgi:hypothetical protein
LTEKIRTDKLILEVRCKMSFLNKKEKEQQEKALAMLRKMEIATKRRRLQESGYVESQMGMLTSQDRVISLGHYAKSSAQAKQHYEWEKARQKRAKDKKQSIVIVKKS